jgi:Flp pilus assembly pilin Flp
MLWIRQPAELVENPTEAAGDSPETSAPAREQRRGATMMEYLVCLSFIVAVLILAIQHVGLATGTNFQTTATTMPDGSGSSGP